MNGWHIDAGHEMMAPSAPSHCVTTCKECGSMKYVLKLKEGNNRVNVDKKIERKENKFQINLAENKSDGGPYK